MNRLGEDLFDTGRLVFRVIRRRPELSPASGLKVDDFQAALMAAPAAVLF